MKNISNQKTNATSMIVEK